MVEKKVEKEGEEIEMVVEEEEEAIYRLSCSHLRLLQSFVMAVHDG